MTIKKLYTNLMKKSVKQRIFFCIVLTVMLMLLFFIIKGNFFDAPIETAEEAENADSPQFHISLIDVGVLLAVIVVFCVHKIREKRKHRRL